MAKVIKQKVKLTILSTSRVDGSLILDDTHEVEDIQDILNACGAINIFNTSELPHKHYVNKIAHAIKMGHELYAVRTNISSPRSVYVSPYKDLAKTAYDIEYCKFFDKFPRIEDRRMHLQFLV